MALDDFWAHLFHKMPLSPKFTAKTATTIRPYMGCNCLCRSFPSNGSTSKNSRVPSIDIFFFWPFSNN